MNVDETRKELDKVLGQQRHNGVCPDCGRCPTCGRRNNPCHDHTFIPVPYSPPTCPPVRPYWAEWYITY